MDMRYHGHVEPGGDPIVRELPHLIVTKVSVGSLDNNAYFLRCRSTGQELLIDAADEPDRLLATAGDGPLTHVVTTHSHPDHWQALPAIVEATGAVTVAHVDDASDIMADTTAPVSDGDVVRIGAVELTVIHLKGHTPGSIALLYDDPTGPPHLWTGDSLFPGGPGKTKKPEDFASLMQELQTKVFDQLPDETWFYPGHGNDSTLGAERPHIPEWLARGW